MSSYVVVVDPGRRKRYQLNVCGNIAELTMRAIVESLQASHCATLSLDTALRCVEDGRQFCHIDIDTPLGLCNGATLLLHDEPHITSRTSNGYSIPVPDNASGWRSLRPHFTTPASRVTSPAPRCPRRSWRTTATAQERSSSRSSSSPRLAPVRSTAKVHPTSLPHHPRVVPAPALQLDVESVPTLRLEQDTSPLATTQPLHARRVVDNGIRSETWIETKEPARHSMPLPSPSLEGIDAQGGYVSDRSTLSAQRGLWRLVGRRSVSNGVRGGFTIQDGAYYDARENADENVRRLGEFLGLVQPSLQLDETNSCMVCVEEEYSLLITYDATTERLYLYSSLLTALPPMTRPDLRLRLYEFLLEKTLLGRDVCGGGVGLVRDKGCVLLSTSLYMPTSQPWSLRTIAPHFVHCLQRWRREVAQLLLLDADRDVEPDELQD